MMRTTLLTLTVPLATILGLGTSAAVPAPLPGPGAVFASIQQLCTAIDAGDADAIAKVLQPLDERDGWQWTRDAASGQMENGPPEARKDGVLFVDVARGGEAVTADSVPAATKALLGRIGGEAAELETRILSVRANCSSERCSWADVAFERSFTRGDGQRVAVPMRATALMRYHTEAPTMRIYLWHASATGPARTLSR